MWNLIGGFRGIVLIAVTAVVVGVAGLGLNYLENKIVAREAAIEEAEKWKEAVRMLQQKLDAEQREAQRKLDAVSADAVRRKALYDLTIQNLKDNFDEKVADYEKELFEARKLDDRIIIPRSLRDRINAAGRSAE